MAQAHDFKLAPTRVIEPTGGPGAELATLEGAARFVGLLLSWRQARPHCDFAAELLLKAAETGKRRDIEAATAQMERALRVEGCDGPAKARSSSGIWSASSTCSTSSATSAAEAGITCID